MNVVKASNEHSTKIDAIESLIKQSWIPPQPILNIGIMTRLICELFRAKSEIWIVMTNDNIKNWFNKKNLSSCAECGEENSILTQVSSGLEVTFLCSDCYKLKYLQEVQNEIKHIDKKKIKKRKTWLHKK